MGSPFNCKCEERKKPVDERAWVVTEYKWNSGAFVKDGGEFSDYSCVRCLECGAQGRTKAMYVEDLGHMGWEEAMNEHLNRAYDKNSDGVWVRKNGK